MAITITAAAPGAGVQPAESFGKRSKHLVGTVSFDDSYPAGGEAFDLTEYFPKGIDCILFEPKDGYTFTFDGTNNKVIVNAAYVTTSALILPEGGKDIKGSGNTDAENADAGSDVTNGGGIAAYAAVAAGAWTKGAITNPDVGRNIGINIQNDSGGPLDLYEGVMTFTITGKFNGSDQTDTITITSTGANKAVATGKWRVKYGVKPFDTVTDIVLDHVPADGLKIGACPGSKIGLRNGVSGNVEASIVKIFKNAANLAVTGTYSTTHHTVNLGTLADNNDFCIYYVATPYVEGLVQPSQVSAGTNLATLTDVHWVAWGE